MNTETKHAIQDGIMTNTVDIYSKATNVSLSMRNIKRAKNVETIDGDIAVSPCDYLYAEPFIIGFLVRTGQLTIKKDANGRILFMKKDMDEFAIKIGLKPNLAMC